MRRMSLLATLVLVLALLAPQTGSPAAISDAGRVLVFFSANDGVHGRELWRSDGTELGTSLVKDIRPGEKGSHPALFAVIRGRVFFAANDGRHGLRMWVSDGTSADTRLIEGSPAPLPEPWSGGGGAVARGSLYFTTHHQNKIWRTDGTAAGTVPFEGECLASARGVVFFVHNATSEVWRTNGTAAGTFMLQRLRHPSGLRAYPSFTDVGGTMIYEGRDVRHGHEPWKSDGTVRGTTLLKDIVPGPDSSGPSMRGGTVDRAFFVTSSVILWTSDGTSAGTVRVYRFRRWVGVLGGHPVLATTLFFYASAAELGAELWKSDGTHDGTGIVNDINLGHPSSYPLGAAALDGDLFFQADDGSARIRAVED